MFKLDLENEVEPEILGGNRIGNKIGKIGNIHWIIEKAREFQKSIYFCFTDYAKAFDCADLWITANCGKFFKRWEYQTTLPDSWEICMQAKKDMEHRTGSKLGKE